MVLLMTKMTKLLFTLSFVFFSLSPFYMAPKLADDVADLARGGSQQRLALQVAHITLLGLGS